MGTSVSEELVYQTVREHTPVAWSRVLLVKLLVPEPFYTFPKIYATSGFINVFTKASHCPLSWKRLFQCTSISSMYILRLVFEVQLNWVIRLGWQRRKAAVRCMELRAINWKVMIFFSHIFVVDGWIQSFFGMSRANIPWNERVKYDFSVYVLLWIIDLNMIFLYVSLWIIDLSMIFSFMCCYGLLI